MRYVDEVSKQTLDFENMSEQDQLDFLDSICENDYKLVDGMVIEQELFYQTYSSEIELSVFQDRINSLLFYLNINKDFIEGFIETRKKYLERSLSKPISAEMGHAQEESYYNIENYFTEYLYISIISLLYIILESTLKNIVDLLAHKIGGEFVMSSQNKPVINKYIDFIRRECNMNVNLPKDFWKEIKQLRQIRNQFTHSLKDDLAVHNRGENETTYKSYLTHDYCLESFGLVCELIEEIERLLLSKYPESSI
ncbi:hypothetical protein [Paenibacillus polymyxa]|uniref:hypothetical protein n=2 Tax=Paenibacillus TaxID=44249 RepID=UPI0004729F6C